MANLTLLLPLLFGLTTSMTRAHPVTQEDGESLENTINVAVDSFEPDTDSWSQGANNAFQVWGDGCNTTELELIGEGLEEVLKLADHARSHVRRYGADDSFTRWFGVNGSTIRIEGLFDRIVSGDKQNISFTCNDIDNTCNGQYGVIPGYFSSSTPELTVICPTYYISKMPLNHMCTAGNTISSQGSEATDGGWFLHRLLHLPASTGGGLSDVVDSAHDAVELAKGVNASQAEYNIHSIQYYALDVYAQDLLLPGEGCLGDTSVEVEESE